MPSAYTQPIKGGISFDSFLMRCARAMGACVMMRDDPLDTPIPEQFEPSDYHLKRVAETKEELGRLRVMSVDEAQTEAQVAYAADMQRNIEGIQDSIALRNKYQAMLAQVAGWEPPTSDHAGLKKFMLEQLQDSMRFDCSEDYYREHAPVLQTGEQWKTARIDQCMRDIAYNENMHAEEVARTDSRNLWLRQLRSSLATGSQQ